MFKSGAFLNKKSRNLRSYSKFETLKIHEIFWGQHYLVSKAFNWTQFLCFYFLFILSHLPNLYFSGLETSYFDILLFFFTTFPLLFYVIYYRFLFLFTSLLRLYFCSNYFFILLSNLFICLLWHFILFLIYF